MILYLARSRPVPGRVVADLLRISDERLGSGHRQGAESSSLGRAQQPQQPNVCPIDQRIEPLDDARGEGAPALIGAAVRVTERNGTVQRRHPRCGGGKIDAGQQGSVARRRGSHGGGEADSLRGVGDVLDRTSCRELHLAPVGVHRTETAAEVIDHVDALRADLEPPRLGIVRVRGEDPRGDEPKRRGPALPQLPRLVCRPTTAGEHTSARGEDVTPDRRAHRHRRHPSDGNTQEASSGRTVCGVLLHRRHHDRRLLFAQQVDHKPAWNSVTWLMRTGCGPRQRLVRGERPGAPWSIPLTIPRVPVGGRIIAEFTFSAWTSRRADGGARCCAGWASLLTTCLRLSLLCAATAFRALPTAACESAY
ncbi:MAG: hypothetical protein JWQ92_777 [Amnibacterium sp.]|nr:hypothetical protein [Amnibacterium sp.]